VRFDDRTLFHKPIYHAKLTSPRVRKSELSERVRVMDKCCPKLRKAMIMSLLSILPLPSMSQFGLYLDCPSVEPNTAHNATTSLMLTFVLYLPALPVLTAAVLGSVATKP
jgi:hypothetical protein